MATLKQPKLYYYMWNSHHYLISRIDEKTYWIFDLTTNRYTDERWDTLKKAIKWVEKYTSNLRIFDTYRQLFEEILRLEYDYDIMDLYWDKNLIERESLHNEKINTKSKSKSKWVNEWLLYQFEKSEDKEYIKTTYKNIEIK